jgi:hypothetical protein
MSQATAATAHLRPMAEIENAHVGIAVGKGVIVF